MIKKTYIIKYIAQDKIGRTIKKGEFKVKNKESSIQAQIAFEDYLKRNYLQFNKLIVHDCKEDIGFDNLFGDKKNGDFDNPFGNIFGDIFK